MADQLTVRVSAEDVPALMNSVGFTVTDADIQREGLKESDHILFPDFVKFIASRRQEQTLSQARSASAEVSQTDLDTEVTLLVVDVSGDIVLEVSLEKSCFVSDLVVQVRQAHARTEMVTRQGDAKTVVISQPDFTDEETEEVRLIFSQLCSWGGDAMDASRFGDAMHYLGHDVTEAELEDILAHYNAQSAGFINFPTFLGLLGGKMENGTFGEGIGSRDRVSLLSPAGFRLVEDATLCQNGLKTGDTVTLAKVPHASYAMYEHPVLTDAEMGEFRNAFNQFSKDSGDVTSSSELGHAKRILGQNPTEAELRDIIAEVDADGSGIIDFLSF